MIVAQHKLIGKLKTVPTYIWDFGLPAKPCKNAIYFILNGDQVQMYVTSQLGIPYLVGEGGSGTEVQITSPDDSITITQAGQNFTLKVSQVLQDAISAATGTDLTYSAAAATGTVNSSSGTDAVIPAATNTEAGLFLPSEKVKLAALQNVILTSLDSSVTITGAYPDINLSVSIPPSGIESVQPGTNTTVDNTDPQNPIVNSDGTDLSNTPAPTNITVNSSTGNDTALPLGNNTNAGLVIPGGNEKLQNTSGTNSGDQTSIVGISGTKSEFNAALTDGDFLFTGDVTQYTDEMARDAVGNGFDSTLVYNDGSDSFGRAAITNDVSIPLGSNVATLATVNSNTGTFGNGANTPTFSVNAKGLITAVVNTPIQITESQVTNLTTDLAAKQATLVSGTNIKTVNGNSLLGSGDLAISSTATATRMFKIGAGDTVSYFGDSYTVGTGATTTSLGFARLTVERLGVIQDNQGFAGGGILKAFERSNTTGSVRATAKNNTKNIVMVGFNDHIRGGADARELAKIENGYNALFSSFFAEIAIPANSGSITQTGTWTAFTPSTFPVKATTLSGQPLSNTTSGNKLSYTFTGTTLIIGYVTNDATATGVTFSNFDVVVDGATLTNVNTNDKSLAVTDSYYNNQYAPGAVIFKNLAAGSHTVEIVNKTSNLLYIDYLGHLMAPNACPDVLVCSIPLINAAGYATQPTYSPSALTSAQADTAIRNAMANFPEYPLVWADINTGFLSTDVSGDTIHYNNTGHARLADNIMKVITNNSQSPVISIYNDRIEPVTLFGANYRIVNGMPLQMRSGITSEGIFLDTTAASTLAGLIYHSSTAGVNTQFLKWTKAGNFGLNTATDPTFKLEVNGTTRFVGDSSFGANIVTDITIAKTAPKLTLNNNVATISASWQIIGNNAYARNLIRSETATKVTGLFISPNGAPADIASSKALIGVFDTDYGASQTNTSGIYFSAGTFNGLNSNAAGTGTVKPLMLGINAVAGFTLSTGNVGSFLNPLTVPTAVALTDAATYAQAGGISVNTTTTVLSSATLNSTYPNVPVGHRVICHLITGAPAIYTKATEAGSSDVWLSTNVTTVV